MSVPSNNLRPLTRFVTGHNSADGKSVFESAAVNESPPVINYPGGMQIAFYYGTSGFPVDLSNDGDIKIYHKMIQNPPGIAVLNGSAARVIDFPPACTTPMHRSMSLNYNFVIEGEVEVILDSGEKRILKRGDGLVQRAINHAWRNTSQTEWARITAVVLPVREFEVAERQITANLPPRTKQSGSH
ncbi:uncharacterized protein PV06_04101 [Exophiala oligosperma]|uniref:Cupin type-2 domain-containing protein n=1 Tax=Exophiala oligosperma TaxID=215243 RepID=A0A0D2DT91_9EURO|nr:uncharacterized protein PV06_04101 [Exophiala oligosperma]KIW45740.1 hypothetical protein PV06_04101 [Exophiala oligosperma]